MMSCKPLCPVCPKLRSAAVAVVGDGGIEALSEEALDRAAGLPDGEAVQHYARPATCLHEAYLEVCDRAAAEFSSAFTAERSWASAFDLGRSRVLAYMAAHPAEARLCFVEALRGDRELRRLREARRRGLIGFLFEERARRGGAEDGSRLPIELLLGATFHEISTAVAAGATADLPALEPRLRQLAALFEPAPRWAFRTAPEAPRFSLAGSE